MSRNLFVVPVGRISVVDWIYMMNTNIWVMVRFGMVNYWDSVGCLVEPQLGALVLKHDAP